MKDNSKPWVIKDLAKAMEHLEDGKMYISSKSADVLEPLESYEIACEKSSTHRALGMILCASESLLKARNSLASAMHNASSWYEDDDG